MGAKKSYHHGSLPEVLRAAAAELVAERGVGGFSLREVARRAGVSHAAPTHHFGDASGLLTAIAVEGFDHLATALAEAAADVDAVTALRRCGAAYVATAVRFPGHFAVIFRDDLLNTDDPELQRSGSAAFGGLASMVEAIRADVNPDVDVVSATTMCWATMQGLVTLAPALASSPIGDDFDLDGMVDSLTTMLLDGLRPR